MICDNIPIYAHRNLSYMKELHRVTFYVPDKLWTDLKIIGVLTHRSMSDIIRISIQEKINKLKDEQMNKIQ
jgi:hypothetical protein